MIIIFGSLEFDFLTTHCLLKCKELVTDVIQITIRNKLFKSRCLHEFQMRK